MSWLFVPGLEGSSLGSSSPDQTRAPSVMSKGKPMRPASLSRAWKIKPWMQRLSGLTLAPSTLDRGVASWIASLRASRASQRPWPDSGEAAPTTDGSGPMSPGSFATWDAEASFWKTCEGSLLSMMGLPPGRYSATWPTSGSLRNGTCSRRPKRALPTVGNGCSYSRGAYPTPSATSYGSSQNGTVPLDRPSRGTPSLETWARHWPTPNVPNGGRINRPGISPTGRAPDGRKKQIGLEDRARNWPTPKVATGDYSYSRGDPDKPVMTLQGAAKLWPTPQASEPESKPRPSRAATGRKTEYLGRTVLAWPTPTVSDADRASGTYKRGNHTLKGEADAWATPSARDWRSGEASAETLARNSGPLSEQAVSQCSRRVRLPTTSGAHIPNPADLRLLRPVLNPVFVEALMGWPIGWTGSEPVATEWSRWWRRMRGELLRLG